MRVRAMEPKAPRYRPRFWTGRRPAEHEDQKDGDEEADVEVSSYCDDGDVAHIDETCKIPVTCYRRRPAETTELPAGREKPEPGEERLHWRIYR